MTSPKPRILVPEGLSAEEQLDWLGQWITDQTGHEAPSCVPQKGLREGEGVVESILRMLVERDDEIGRLRHVIYILEQEAASTYSEAQQGHAVMPCPTLECPVCGAPEVDMDGFGCLACPRDPALCYCSHPSRTDGVCGICGDPESRCTAPDMHDTGIRDPWERSIAAKRLEVGDRLRMPDKRTWCTVEEIRPEEQHPACLFVTFAEDGFIFLALDELVYVRRRGGR